MQREKEKIVVWSDIGLLKVKIVSKDELWVYP